MKKAGLALLLIAALFSCRDKNSPDVSGIKIQLQTERFEQDFFALDTNNIMQSLTSLDRKYPNFLADYLQNIMQLPPISDTGQQTLALIKRFIADYKPVKDSADKIFSHFSDIENEVKKGLQYVKYYFPAYKAPSKFITFIGPMEGVSDVITIDAIATGLQLHLGKDCSFYTSSIGQQLFPEYKSRRFAPEYISVYSMQNVINDISPDRSGGRPLIEQMVEKGKRQYVLDKIMPGAPDTLKIGYTAYQLNGCFKNEGEIWNYFVAHGMLYTTDPDLLKGFIEDGPSTQEMATGSPGGIGVFVGWQIVKKYMEKHKDLSLFELLKMNPQKIYEESKYKPG